MPNKSLINCRRCGKPMRAIDVGLHPFFCSALHPTPTSHGSLSVDLSFTDVQVPIVRYLSALAPLHIEGKRVLLVGPAEASVRRSIVALAQFSQKWDYGDELPHRFDFDVVVVPHALNLSEDVNSFIDRMAGCAGARGKVIMGFWSVIGSDEHGQMCAYSKQGMLYLLRRAGLVVLDMTSLGWILFRGTTKTPMYNGCVVEKKPR